MIIKFEEGKSYYFKNNEITDSDTSSQKLAKQAIFYLKNYENLTLSGNNTTLLLDKSNDLVHWFNIDNSKNINVEGFNLELSQPMYTLATVDNYKIYKTGDKSDNKYSGHYSTPYIDITTPISLGITEEFVPGYAESGASVAFGLPYTGDVNRSHIYINSIVPLDVSANKYRVYIRADKQSSLAGIITSYNYDQAHEKIAYMYENGLKFMIGIPGWGRYGADDGSGAVVVTNSTDLSLENINVFSSPTMVFHMRNNYGTFNIKNCNVTPKNEEDALAAWVDVFHVKENRCKFVIEDCLFEKAQDDIFNFSTSYLKVTEVVANNEFKMECPALGGNYWMPLRVGDTVTLLNEATGAFVGRTTIKEVKTVNSKPWVVVNDTLSGLEVGVAVYVDSLGQPNSVIKNCTIRGTYRFRTPLTVENCEIDQLYAWIDTYPGNEGPIPRNITFKDCTFNPIKPSTEQISAGYISYISDTYMMQIGTRSSAANTEYKTENIQFINCKLKDGTAFTSALKLIDDMNGTGAGVTFQ